MPRQLSGVTVTDNGDGTCNVAIGLYGRNVDISYLFDRSYEDTQLVKRNFALAYRINGAKHPCANEFVQDINGPINNGIQGRQNKLLISGIEETEPDFFNVSFRYSATGPTYGVNITRMELEDDPLDDDTIVENLVPFLRIIGATSLTASVIAQIHAKKWWK